MAILLVLLHHLAIYGGLRPNTAVDKIFYMVATAGWVGVDLFFVLSGFLITGILYDARGEHFYFRHFYIRRCLRIFPLYYAVLVLFFVVLSRLREVRELGYVIPADQMWYWTYSVNVIIAADGWPQAFLLAHFWSLAVEEQFYFVWPFVIFLLPLRRLLVVCATCTLLGLAVRLGLVWSGHHLAAYVLTPARIDSLAVGAILALLARRPQGLSVRRRLVWLVAVGTGAPLALIMARRHELSTMDALVDTIGYTLLACLFGAGLLLVLTASARSRLGGIFSSRGLRLMGRYSYGLYVLHHPILIVTSRQLFTASDLPVMWGSQLPAFGLYVMVAGGLSVAAAVASWHAYESPFLNLKKAFPYSRPVDVVHHGSSRSHRDAHGP